MITSFRRISQKEMLKAAQDAGIASPTGDDDLSMDLESCLGTMHDTPWRSSEGAASKAFSKAFDISQETDSLYFAPEQFDEAIAELEGIAAHSRARQGRETFDDVVVLIAKKFAQVLIELDGRATTSKPR